MIFKHSGDWGDMIYAMPVIRAMGGGHLLAGTTPGPRQKMNEAKLQNIRPLIESQSYITGVSMMGRQLMDCVDLDLFRKRIEHSYTYGKTLAEYHLECFGLERIETDTAWITGITKERQAKVVINRSPRYHNHNFPWKRILKKYDKDIVFIGTESDRSAFVKEVGSVPFYKTNTLLDAAMVMAGADLFIGNQSCCYAIAEGMKLNVIQETYISQPDCIFRRANAVQVAGDYLELPDL